MRANSMSLASQINYIFEQLEDELLNATAGTVVIQIRNNEVGKFGVRHNPIESRNGKLASEDSGMSREQVKEFRQMAVDALKYKRNWTHGEISYDFSVRAKVWSASISYESNYNLANMFRYNPKQRDTYRELS